MRHYLPSNATTMSFDNDLHLDMHASNKNIYHLLTCVFLSRLNGFDQFFFVHWQRLILDKIFFNLSHVFYGIKVR